MYQTYNTLIKGYKKMKSLEEKKGTMNSEYFGFMSRDEIQ